MTAEPIPSDIMVDVMHGRFESFTTIEREGKRERKREREDEREREREREIERDREREKEPH